jgi:hypothetical protein
VEQGEKFTYKKKHFVKSKSDEIIFKEYKLTSCPLFQGNIQWIFKNLHVCSASLRNPYSFYVIFFLYFLYAYILLKKCINWRRKIFGQIFFVKMQYMIY